MIKLARLRGLRGRRLALFVLVLLLVEFLDEFIFGMNEAAWPLIRDDLGLSYEQIGLLFAIPSIIASFIEPVIGLMGDTRRRRMLIIGGGVTLGLTLLVTASSTSFEMMLLSFIVLFPASGALVNLSQATLMDLEPQRHEQNMARWTFAGSVGVVGGALALGAAVTVGLGWRELFAAEAIMALLLVLVLRRLPITTAQQDNGPANWREGLGRMWAALRNREVLRWLVLLEFSDLVLDVLHGYLALYFVDVVGLDPAAGGIAVVVWTVVGLVGDFLLIPLLERVRGVTYLRISAVIMLVLLPLFLIVPGFLPKLVLLALMGLFNAGWYAILMGNLYTELPDQSGTVMAVDSVTGLAGSLLPLSIGLAAAQVGLGAAMWLLLLGPIALLIGLPRR